MVIGMSAPTTLTPTPTPKPLSRKRERGESSAELKPLARLREREGPVAQQREGEGPLVGAKKVPETGGPAGPEPTRYGDWERKGRCIDF